METEKIIGQILEGNFCYENGSLNFSCSKIELTLKRGEQREGSFCIRAPRGVCANGTVASSDLRMECLSTEFAGADEEIFYRFHGEHLEEGDVVKGEFFVISSQGEYYLPFVAVVAYDTLNSSEGPVKNLFQFANLAKAHWAEAVKLFYEPEFAGICSGRDAQYAEVYRALSVCPGREQQVEEFLIQANKKQKVEYLLEEDQIFLEFDSQLGPETAAEHKIAIVRNGWGFTRLFVELNGSFLFTEKELLTDDDFLGNRCSLPIFIDGSKCRMGRNFGEIYLYNCYVSLTIPVTVQCGGGRRQAGALRRKRAAAELMRLYLAFRAKKLSSEDWLRESEALVERLADRNENDAAARLLQAQILITRERYNEAGWILDHVAELLERDEKADQALKAYYLYLTTLLHPQEEYVKQATARVERLSRRDDAGWRTAWLLLYLSPDYRNSPTGRWTFLERQFAAGCTSPLLYMEAASLLNANPALLRKLGRFERQALWYAARNDLLKQEVTEQLLYLAGKAREYNTALFRTLAVLYGKQKDVRLLQEICTLLIKGGMAGSLYFSWYQAGVEERLRITNLFEYYMMSLNLREPREIPRTVLLYFSYQNNLDYAHTAYLYDYILRRQEKLGELADAYRPRMEYFVLEQIRKEHISRPLANLYNRLLQPGMIDRNTCGPLSRLLFAHLIQVEDKRLKKAYVYQPGNLQPEEYGLSDCDAWVALYGGEYTIALEDAWGNRFIPTAEYTLEKLMLPGRYQRFLLPFPHGNPAFDIYLCGREQEEKESLRERVHRYLRVLASGRASIALRRKLYLQALRCYDEADDMRSLDDYLERIPPWELTAEERGQVIRYMARRGRYGLARQWLNTYGPYFVEPKALTGLIGPMMEQDNMAENPMLTAAAIYAFRREKYDGVTLAYLDRHYRGLIRQMRDIWKAARSFEVECVQLSERILVQMLYTGAFVGEKMDIFRYYVSQGAKTEVEEAFLAQCAYGYFVREKLTEKEVFQDMLKLYRQGKSLRRICKLAFVKYCAEEQETLAEESRRLAEGFLLELLAEGVHLTCFQAYSDLPQVRLEMGDKTLIEYRAAPGGRARIHYVITDGDGGSQEYTSRYMRQVCGGVYFQEFILFFGETLQYYITEEAYGQEPQLTESGARQKDDFHMAGERSRFELINDIIVSRSMQDGDAADDLLEEYYRKDYFNGQLFRLK